VAARRATSDEIFCRTAVRKSKISLALVRRLPCGVVLRDDKFGLFDRTPTCVRQTRDRGIHRASVASRGKSCCCKTVFRVSRGRREMYSGHGRLCICLSLCLHALAAFSHYWTDPDVTWGNGRGCPQVVHYWSDLQSVHGFHC